MRNKRHQDKYWEEQKSKEMTKGFWFIIKIIVSITLLLLATLANAQSSWVPEKEFMFLETHWDYAKTSPGDKYSKDYGIHAAIELGMRSYIPGLFGVEAKAAFETFPELTGGYTSYGGGFGPYFVMGDNEQIMYYAGIRIVPWLYRTNPNTREKERSENIGLELKWTYTFNETFYIGLRYTLDTANDMKIIDRDLIGETRWGVNFTIGINLRKIGAYAK